MPPGTSILEGRGLREIQAWGEAVAVTISFAPTDARLQIHVSAGGAEPRQELHPLQAEHWEAEPA